MLVKFVISLDIDNTFLKNTNRRNNITSTIFKILYYTTYIKESPVLDFVYNIPL